MLRPFPNLDAPVRDRATYLRELRDLRASKAAEAEWSGDWQEVDALDDRILRAEIAFGTREAVR